MRAAAIDCGTNSLRLLIADVEDGQVRDVVRTMRVVRLGEGVDVTGRLAPEALERAWAGVQDYADQIVHDVIAERLRRPDVADLLRVADPAAMAEAADLRRDIRALEARLDALASDTALSERMLAKRAEALEAELDAATARLDTLNASTATPGPLSGVLASRDPAQAYLAADLMTQRAVVDTLARVTFLPGKKGRPKGWTPGAAYFDPESVRIDWRGLA